MEDDKIKEIFSSYQPELSSSFQFMSKLKKNMEAVEIIKQHNVALRKRNKLAVAIAGFCGFAMGVLLTLIFPMIEDLIKSVKINLPMLSSSALNIDFSNIAWLLVAAISITTSISVYELASTRLTLRQELP